ncbi:MAG: ABC-type transport auxiliary lipoprotein family protein [Candidatus Acidiferrales bacterium]
MRTRATVIVLAIIVGGICGCGSIPQTKYYQLNPPSEPNSAAVANPFPVTLLVGPLKASHLYREDRLVYATDSEEMGTYDVHRWAEPPTEMIQELLWRSLRASHQYRGVSMLSSSSHGDFLLDGNLYDFKEISGSTLTARVSLELQLRDMKTGAIVWTHAYAHDEPVSGKTVSDVVAALDQNTHDFVSDAEASLSEYFAAHPTR